jgi:hypothetical protein
MIGGYPTMCIIVFQVKWKKTLLEIKSYDENYRTVCITLFKKFKNGLSAQATKK